MPLTSQIDDLVEKWAADQPKEGTGKAGPIRVKTDDEEYMLLPYSDDRFVKPIFIDGVPLLPGSRFAVDAGCICDPERKPRLGAALRRRRPDGDQR